MLPVFVLLATSCVCLVPDYYLLLCLPNAKLEYIKAFACANFP